MTTTLNGAVQGNATFTNSDLTVEQTSALARMVTRATSAVVVTTNDNKFWRTTIVALSSGGATATQIGVCNSSFSYNPGAGGYLGGGIGGNANASVGFDDGGGVYINRVQVATLSFGYAAGDVIDTECSRSGNYARWKNVTTGSAWSADIDISAVTGDLYPAYALDGGAGATGKFTADFTSSTGATSGFTPFDATSVALTGVGATGSPGSLGNVFSLALTAAPATASVGSLSPRFALGLVGNGALAGVGTLGVAMALALTGAPATGSPGTLAPRLEVALAGNQGVGSPGILAPAFSLSLSNVSATGEVGTLIAGRSIALSGVAGTGLVSSFGVRMGLTLVGSSATGYVGFLTAPVPPTPLPAYPSPASRTFSASIRNRGFTTPGRPRSFTTRRR